MKQALRWDIFCRVIDNYGDIGVCWRLAADLAARGDTVRLWVDDQSPLNWMAPGARQGQCSGIQVLDWARASDAQTLADLEPADVWIEAFGCELPVPFFARHLPPSGDQGHAPVWINLEYLSAEAFAERSHRLPSPVMAGVAKGCTKHFFYPGFTPGSGGLIRERDLAKRQAAFDRRAWLAARGIGSRGEQLVSLFCYEPEALLQMLTYWQAQPQPIRLLVTHGRAAAALRAALTSDAYDPSSEQAGRNLSISYLEPLTQLDFDHLLWTCDLNFVRGEDSVIRAIWAAKPFIWQIYPQHDDAHRAKLEAFLDVLEAPVAVRQAHRIWNGIQRQAMPAIELTDWAAWAGTACDRLRAQTDLSSRLTTFVQMQREGRHRTPQTR